MSTQTELLGFLKVIGSPFSMIVLVLFLVPLPVASAVSAQQVDAQDLVDTLGSVAKVPVFPQIHGLFRQNTYLQNKKHTLTCQGGTGCYRFNYQPGS